MSSFVLEDAELDETLQKGLAATEVALQNAVVSDYPFVQNASRHLIDAGGKRVRPMLVWLTSQFGDGNAPGVCDASVVVELIHLATLYHDDVMDEADLRRGAESANHRWDNSIAILTGDFLFARASAILADLGPEFVRIQAETFERLCIGQIREAVGAQEGEDPYEHYIAVLADKTGSLIGTSARFGSLLGGCDRATIDALTRFGEMVGIAFQLADDLLDIASDSTDSGKVPGTDLKEGVRTLPTFFALDSTDDESARLRELLNADLTDDALHAEALGLLRAHKAMDQARAVMLEWADKARAELATLPPVPARQALEAFTDLVVNRAG